MFHKITLGLLLSLALTACQSGKKHSAVNPKNIKQATHLLQNHRQMTFSGKRSGEGYFSHDGQTMVFQSEREKSNPFYQIYTMDMKSRKIRRISNGIGKTTCSWIHPNKKKVLYSSTHQDKKAKLKMREEIEFRASGKTRRYSWDYDENYDIFVSPIKGGKAKNLTKTLGYDAEGSYSPDGKSIVFASNREAYSRDLTETEKKIFEKDKSYFMDLYIMDSNGRNVRQLTKSLGYDGGPFFSPDGGSIVWRRFTPDGHSAEVFTMDLTTGKETQVTRLGAMSWAPFYHPSGDYLVFTSNLYGYSNFELFMVDTKGSKEPIRITQLDEFDGLPVFTPDGTQLTWNRKLPSGSQIFTGDWNDSEARKALGLPERFPMPSELRTEIHPEDARSMVQFLSSADMKGRPTGSAEEKIYTQKIADYFKELGLKPIHNSYFQNFSFSKKAQLSMGSELTMLTNTQDNLVLNQSWRPLSFSKSGAIAASEVVFAGYGITAPEASGQKAYNSYTGLEVKDKWVMFFRYVPEDVGRERREHLLRYSRLEHKLLVARQLGARGAIIVSGPRAKAKSDLIPFQQNSSTDSGIVAVTIDTESADRILATKELRLKNLQKKLDKEEELPGFLIPNIKLSAQVNIRREKGTGRNVYGLLKVPGAIRTLVIGAHGDHLGQGKSSSSTMKSSDSSDIHFGADDNASGVAGVLELAHWFKNETKKSRPRHNILFAVWSGEELGNLGSTRFTKRMKRRMRLNVSAYINMDMIGRLTNEGKVRPLNAQGVASSPDWPTLIEQNPAPIGLQLSDDPYLPTDAMSFYVANIPVLSFFSGVHSDYHSPRDTYDKIDYLGLTNTVKYIGVLAKKLAWNGRIPKYNRVQQTPSKKGRGFRIFLGTIPDYSSSSKTGVKLSGVVKGGPAEQAGLKDGDIIVRLSTYDIKTIHDYVYSLESMRPGQPTNITVLRKGKKKELKITPKARE